MTINVDRPENQGQLDFCIKQGLRKCPKCGGSMPMIGYDADRFPAWKYVHECSDCGHRIAAVGWREVVSRLALYVPVVLLLDLGLLVETDDFTTDAIIALLIAAVFLYVPVMGLYSQLVHRRRPYPSGYKPEDYENFPAIVLPTEDQLHQRAQRAEFENIVRPDSPELLENVIAKGYRVCAKCGGSMPAIAITQPFFGYEDVHECSDCGHRVNALGRGKLAFRWALGGAIFVGLSYLFQPKYGYDIFSLIGVGFLALVFLGMPIWYTIIQFRYPVRSYPDGYAPSDYSNFPTIIEKDHAQAVIMEEREEETLLENWRNSLLVLAMQLSRISDFLMRKVSKTDDRPLS